jgi:hypothetical protein
MTPAEFSEHFRNQPRIVQAEMREKLDMLLGLKHSPPDALAFDDDDVRFLKVLRISAT